MSSEIINSLNVRRTVLEMLRDRGYNIDEYISMYNVNLLQDDFTLDLVKHYKNLISSNKTDILVKNDKNEKCFVSFIIETRIKPTFIRDSISKIKKDNDLSSPDIHILITNVKPNNSILKIINEDNDLSIQIIWAKKLIINITKHDLQPKFRKMSEEEIASIISRFSLKSKYSLPIMLSDDPVSQYYNLVNGNVLEIIRVNQMGQNISYRCIK